MADTALCDQCGKRLTEEDFKEGRAFRDRADVFCDECARMYAKEERDRKKTAVTTAKRRKTSATGIKGRRKPTAHTRAMPRAGGARSTGAMRRPQKQDASTMVFLIAAAAVAVIAAAVILVVLRNRRAQQAPPPEDQVIITPVNAVPPQPPTPDGTPPQPQPQPEPQPQPQPQPRPNPRTPHGRSLFGPGGELHDSSGK
jgi:hypothetical protein